MNLRNSSTQKTVSFILVIGLLLIVLASILTLIKDGGFWINASATITGAVGGVLIGAGITGFVNLDPLQEIKSIVFDSDKKIEDSLNTTKIDILQNIEGLKEYYNDALKEVHTARISSSRKKECTNRLQSLSSKKTIYRYFETLNSLGQKEWRMKDLSFSISSDRQRINTQIFYSFDINKSFSYVVQAAYIGKHLILISEEANDLDEPIVEVYPDLRVGGQKKTFPGISIRYPWGKQSTLLYTYSMLSEEWLLTDAVWEEIDQGYWVLKQSERVEAEKYLRDVWENEKNDVQFFL